MIATPSNTHFEITRDALKSGKHVLCEKPLCMCVQEASELSQLANELGLVLMTGHVFLFNAGIEKIKQIIDNDELGSIRYLSSIRTNLGPIRSDVNAAFDLATHDISIFNWLIGMEPKTVVASGGDFVRRGIHDVVFINLQYPNGQIASVHASWLNPKKVRQMTIVGAERMATWDDLNFGNPVAIYESGANATEEYSSFGEFLQVSMWDGDVRMPKISHREPLKSQAQYFVDGIVAGVVHKSNSDFSLGIIRVLDAIQYSLKNGGVRTEIGINTPLNN